MIRQLETTITENAINMKITFTYGFPEIIDCVMKLYNFLKLNSLSLMDFRPYQHLSIKNSALL